MKSIIDFAIMGELELLTTTKKQHYKVSWLLASQWIGFSGVTEEVFWMYILYNQTFGIIKHRHGHKIMSLAVLAEVKFSMINNMYSEFTKINFFHSWYL